MEPTRYYFLSAAMLDIFGLQWLDVHSIRLLSCQDESCCIHWGWDNVTPVLYRFIPMKTPMSSEIVKQLVPGGATQACPHHLLVF